MTATPTASQQFQRAVRGLPFTLAYTWGLNDEALPDDDSVTVAVVDADGNTVTTGVVTVGDAEGGTQTATAVIAAAALSGRTVLTVTWAYTISAAAVAVTSTVDVCDGRLFSIADYAAYPEIAAKNLTPAQLEQARIDAEDFLERECGRAFTGRYGSEQHLIVQRRHRLFGHTGTIPDFGSGVGRLPLRRPHVSLIRSITRSWTDDNGPHTATLDLTHLHLDTFASVIDYHSPTDGLWGRLTVAYEHGEPVADVRRVCAILARHRLIKGPLDDRATQISVEGGGSVNLLTPGIQGSITGIAEVDSFLQRYNSHATSFVSGA